MRRKLFIIALLTGVMMLLGACKPSDRYAGEWYGLSSDNEQVKMDFSKDQVLTIEKDSGEQQTYEINQHSSGFINEVRYFGIKLNDENYYVVFENKKDENNAILVKQTNVASDFEDVVGDIVVKMNREDYPSE